jgi:hypothetical protein
MTNLTGNELKFVCVGYDTKQQRNDALSYWTDTALQAEAKCRELHPNFDVYYVKHEDEWNRKEDLIRVLS